MTESPGQKPDPEEIIDTAGWPVMVTVPVEDAEQLLLAVAVTEYEVVAIYMDVSLDEPVLQWYEQPLQFVLVAVTVTGLHPLNGENDGAPGKGFITTLALPSAPHPQLLYDLK